MSYVITRKGAAIRSTQRVAHKPHSDVCRTSDRSRRNRIKQTTVGFYLLRFLTGCSTHLEWVVIRSALPTPRHAGGGADAKRWGNPARGAPVRIRRNESESRKLSTSKTVKRLFKLKMRARVTVFERLLNQSIRGVSVGDTPKVRSAIHRV